MHIGWQCTGERPLDNADYSWGFTPDHRRRLQYPVEPPSLRLSPPSVWTQVAEREGFLILYPQDAKGNPDVDDIAFMRGLIDYAVERLRGDRSRVYVTGMSNGGHMAGGRGEVLSARATMGAWIQWNGLSADYS